MILIDCVVMSFHCGSEVRAISRWTCRKKRRKNSPCMRLDVLMIAGEEKRNVLIVSICLLIGVGFTLRSSTHRAVKVLGMREGPVLLHMSA